MAHSTAVGVEHPTMDYVARRGPHRVAVGDLAAAGMPGVVFAPVSGTGLGAVAFAHDWLHPVRAYADTLRYLASWGLVVVAPATEVGPLPSHAGLAYDLSKALQLVARGRLGSGAVAADVERLAVMGHGIGAGAAVIAASRDRAIKAVVTVFASPTRPAAESLASGITAPALHLVSTAGSSVGAESGRATARNWGGPCVLRSVKSDDGHGFAEGRHLVATLLRRKPKAPTQRAVRTLAAGFLLWRLAGQEQIGPELTEGKIAGSMLEQTGPERPTG